MKKIFYLGAALGLFVVSLSFGQDIPQSEVPSLVVNRFQQDYPEAKDIDWEFEDGQYEVEFEIGWKGKDHEIWYDETGEILRHKEDISKGDLPTKVTKKLNADFKKYRIKDVKRIVEGDKTIYKLEAKSFTEEWELTIDNEGNIINKVAD